MTTEISSKEKLRGKSDYIGWLKSMKKHLRKAKFYENEKWVTQPDLLVAAHDLITDYLSNEVLNRTPNNENDPAGLMSYLQSTYGAGLASDEMKVLKNLVILFLVLLLLEQQTEILNTLEILRLNLKKRISQAMKSACEKIGLKRVSVTKQEKN